MEAACLDGLGNVYNICIMEGCSGNLGLKRNEWYIWSSEKLHLSNPSFSPPPSTWFLYLPLHSRYDEKKARLGLKRHNFCITYVPNLFSYHFMNTNTALRSCCACNTFLFMQIPSLNPVNNVSDTGWAINNAYFFLRHLHKMRLVFEFHLAMQNFIGLLRL